MSKSLSLFDHEFPGGYRDVYDVATGTFRKQAAGDPIPTPAAGYETVAEKSKKSKKSKGEEIPGRDASDKEWDDYFEARYGKVSTYNGYTEYGGYTGYGKDWGTYGLQTYTQKIATSDSDPIQVDFVDSAVTKTKGKLGMTFAPGKQQSYGISGGQNRDVVKDVAELQRIGVSCVVSLTEWEEMGKLEIQGLFTALTEQGLGYQWFPFEDMTAPWGMKETYDVVLQIAAWLEAGYDIAVHCKGGLGRTGLIVACVLVYMGGGQISPKEAIEITRAARKGTIQMAEQSRYIYSFADYVAAMAR